VFVAAASATGNIFLWGWVMVPSFDEAAQFISTMVNCLGASIFIRILLVIFLIVDTLGMFSNG
jgi:hypothetical protein